MFSSLLSCIYRVRAVFSVIHVHTFIQYLCLYKHVRTHICSNFHVTLATGRFYQGMHTRYPTAITVSVPHVTDLILPF